ncbi:MAG TPA: hypothetical protein VMD09_05285 [Solirubrobacteraceae bacterium]|nr:hypothetical protein [Solirubrobacteraceae bacterium]
MSPDEERDQINPSEQRGGAVPGEQEAEEKGPWAAQAREGVVPAELGGSDAPEEKLGDDPQLGSSALGQTAQSDEPATETGIDESAGDHADATEQGGADTPEGAEPDLKDAAAGPRQADLDSAG